MTEGQVSDLVLLRNVLVSLAENLPDSVGVDGAKIGEGPARKILRWLPDPEGL